MNKPDSLYPRAGLALLALVGICAGIVSFVAGFVVFGALLALSDWFMRVGVRE